MIQKIADEVLVQVGDLLTVQTGLFFPPKRSADLARGLAAAARDLGCDSAAACAQQILASPLTREKIEILASHLTVGETYFFREKPSLSALENRILPELIRDRRQKGRRLRIWSAGCSSGEEVYTVAILLHRLLPDLDNWQIHLLATDINPLALKKAVRGHYGKWAFRDIPPEIVEQYFTRRERHWEIVARLKHLVKFAYLNLVQDPYPSLVNQTNAMDLIICRNVLMYFSAKQARQVLEKMAHALVEGGWLIIGLTETSSLRFSPLQLVNFPEASVYRKDSRSAGKMEGTACPVAPPVNLPSVMAPRLNRRGRRGRMPPSQPRRPQAPRRSRVRSRCRPGSWNWSIAPAPARTRATSPRPCPGANRRWPRTGSTRPGITCGRPSSRSKTPWPRPFSLCARPFILIRTSSWRILPWAIWPSGRPTTGPPRSISTMSWPFWKPARRTRRCRNPRASPPAGSRKSCTPL